MKHNVYENLIDIFKGRVIYLEYFSRFQIRKKN